MLSVFISYSRDDQTVAKLLKLELESGGHSCFLDEADMRFGASVTTALQAAISTADIFCVVLSPSAVASPWVMRELGAALACSLQAGTPRILPLLLQDCA